MGHGSPLLPRCDEARAAHLEHLTLHVARVLPGGGAVAEVICTCVIGTDLDRPVLNPFPAPGIPHGGPLGRRLRPEAAHAAPEVPW